MVNTFESWYLSAINKNKQWLRSMWLIYGYNCQQYKICKIYLIDKNTSHIKNEMC